MDINIHAAKAHFSKLIERVRLGEEITISKAGRPVARLVPVEPTAQPRMPGSAKGLFSLSGDAMEQQSESVLKDFHA